ncbi:MAG TPA: metalloregulator ArsR/SmtB family transcription factor [Actinomycetota bacterium]|nr:metalloregulator ArsR/SmtB family transcription factor [Actinomycetota bacterium]
MADAGRRTAVGAARRTRGDLAIPGGRARAARCGPEALARYFRVLGDPTRLRIVEALLERERTVSELVALVGAPQSRVSNHLACLKWCRVVRAERRGRHVVYGIADPRVGGLIEAARAVAAEHCDHLASCRRIGPDWV